MAQADASVAAVRVPFVMIGRFWQVSGVQQYDRAGRLAGFGADPLSITEQPAGVISGTYMTLLSTAALRQGIGAIGHLATRPALRRTGGHGHALTVEFEREIMAVAAARNETTRLLVLEAEPDAMAFWAKQGYRWPVGSRYAQPPLDFDPDTCERLYDEVPVLLMVKDPLDPGGASVPQWLLQDTVKTLYEHWYLGRVRAFAPAAARRAEQFIEKVFSVFGASLAPEDGAVPLGNPPARMPAWERVE